MVDGIVSEPGDDANEFVFITPDDTEIKNGEFIFYTGTVAVGADGDEVEHEEKKIFARVTQREQKRGYPDRFMADPGVAPEAVASKLGIATDGVDLYRITATVIGYYDDQLNSFTNPRIVPQPGTEIELADDSDLEDYLTEADADADGSAYIGDLLHRPPGSTNIYLPIDNFASTHLSILASTGSGKSYTASVLVEEMMHAKTRAAMLIVDPHGEYGSLKEMEEDDRFADDADGYSPEVQLKIPDDIHIRISELTLSDLFSVLDDPSDAQEHVLSEAWNALKGDTDIDFDYVTLEQVKARCHEVADNDSTANALEWRLDKALDRDLFDPNKHLALSDLLDPGQCTVLQLDTMNLREQQMLLSVLLRRINRERVKHEKGDASELDFPVFSLLEEGHRFAPADGEARSLPVLSTILSEGRKFGIGIGIISQRPSKIDDDVLSQCMTQIIMQIQNPLDQDAVKKGVEDVGEDLLAELPGLTPGQAIIAGDSVNTPFSARIRNRYTTHEAESLPATEKWQQTWEKANTQETDGYGDADQDEGAADREQTL